MTHQRFLLAAVVLGCCSCGASGTVGGPGDLDGSAQQQLPFTGNDAVGDGELLEALAPCEQRNLELSLCLIAAYYDRGFITVKVDATGHEAPAYSITEGKPFRIGKITTVDSAQAAQDSVGDQQTLRALMEFSTGDWFSRTKVGDFISMVSRRFKDAGYADVNVTPTTKVDVNGGTVDLTFTIERGKRDR